VRDERTFGVEWKDEEDEDKDKDEDKDEDEDEDEEGVRILGTYGRGRGSNGKQSAAKGGGAKRRESSCLFLP